MKNYIDQKTGNVIWKGDLQITKGNHMNMPLRTEAYLPGDERGHINASSLSGSNSRLNIVPQNADVNHGAYYSMERGERTALQNDASIHSTKTAVVNGKPGDRPEAFMVSDNITYADGHTESIHHSFANASYAEQQAWNDESASIPDTFEASNPSDGLRSTMSISDYASLMEATDAELPGIAEDYAAADFYGIPGADVSANNNASAETDVLADAEVSVDNLSADDDLA